MRKATKVLMMKGPSGVGKSHKAREMVAASREHVRVSRDDIRAALYNTGKVHFSYEKLVVETQKQMAATALKHGFIPIIDDTNLRDKNLADWTRFATENDATIEVVSLSDTIENCVARDKLRTGKAHVGVAVIHRQFVEAKYYQFDPFKKIVIVDVDGTLANCDGVRSPYDEASVSKDNPYPVVIKWVQELAKEYTIVICSGRHSTCGDATYEWLTRHEVPFDLLLMREGWMNDKDVEAKQRILDAILGCVPKEQLAFVLDDRQQVIFGCWKKNGLTVFPVRGLGEDTKF